MWGLVSNEGVCVCACYTDEVGVGGQVTVRKLWYSYSSTPRGDCGGMCESRPELRRCC